MRTGSTPPLASKFFYLNSKLARKSQFARTRQIFPGNSHSQMPLKPPPQFLDSEKLVMKHIKQQQGKNRTALSALGPSC